MEIENGVIEETPASAATSDEIGNIDNSATLEVSPETTEQVPTEGTENAETSEAKLPANFREGYKALETDLKRYKPMAEAVEQMGGIEVVNALKPLADILLNGASDPSSVVTTLQQTLLPEHFEAVAWAALDNPSTQEIVLEDPDVQKIICEKFFGGRSMEDVKSALEFAGDATEDPLVAEARKERDLFRNQIKAAEDQRTQQAADARTNELQKRFFVDTATEVVKQFNMEAPQGATEADRQMFSDTVEDLRYAAQGRFLNENADAYMNIQKMYHDGHVSQARIAEARLHSKWQATLIRTAERHSKFLKSSADASRLSQQAKTQGVRPDLTGNAGQTQTQVKENYDLSNPNFLTEFMESFKRDLQSRQ